MPISLSYVLCKPFTASDTTSVLGNMLMRASECCNCFSFLCVCLVLWWELCVHIHICHLSWAKVTVPSDLLSHLLPGPVTTVFERTPELNPTLNPGLSLVGLRIPEHSFVQQLVAQCGSPIALTSANISHSRSTLSIEVREFVVWLALVIQCKTP